MRSMGGPIDSIKTKKIKILILATSIVHYYLRSVALRIKDLVHLGLYFKWYFKK